MVMTDCRVMSSDVNLCKLCLLLLILEESTLLTMLILPCSAWQLLGGTTSTLASFFWSLDLTEASVEVLEP